MALLRLTDVRPDAEIEKLLRATIANAETLWEPLKYEGQYPTTGFGITELRARHLRYGTHSMTVAVSAHYWNMSITASGTWETWFDITMTDMAYLMPTGIFNLEASPRVVELKPSANGQEMPTVNLEQLYALDMARAWFEKPYAASPNNNLKNEVIARDIGIERIGLVGYCIAKRSYLILK